MKFDKKQLIGIVLSVICFILVFVDIVSSGGNQGLSVILGIIILMCIAVQVFALFKNRK